MNSATRTTVSIMGIIAGLAGLEHGIGETLQGNVAPAGAMILSWPDSPFLRVEGGEPAMTLVPNLLITGLLAIFVSLTLLVWVTRFIHKKHGSLILFLLSIILLLVGGGFGPPLLGFILAATATGINAPLTWWRTVLPDRARSFAAKSWPWVFGGCLLAWLLLVPGLGILDYFFGLNVADHVVLVCIASAFGFLLLAILTALAYDAQRQIDLLSAPARPTTSVRVA